MALSKPNTSLMSHLKTLTKPYRQISPSPSPSPSPPSFVSLRFLSFATPEDAAAERRRRKRRLRIEPPLSSLHRTQQQSHPQKPLNPNAPKIPEHVSALTGNRLNLHNKILTLIRENDLDEAALYTRHSIYSNCKPTIFTVNSVLNALLRQCKYSDLLSLHRFITQAGVAPNVITHNLVFQTYLDCRKPDTAMEHYKQMINDAPFNPSPTTYRILVKGLVDNGKLERALELKDEMSEKGFVADPIVYHYLMTGCARNSDSDEVLRLFDELKEKMGGFVENGVVYGSLMKGYFLKGMEKEAMEFYEETSSSKVKMCAVGYSSVLDALSKNGKFDEALKLFERVLSEHDPPKHLTVNLGCFNVVAEGYCAQGRFDEALEVFRKMGNYRCTPDTLSFNVLIDQLCSNGLLSEAEKLYGEMEGKGVSPDEFTFTVLMDTCFKENRPDDASGYFTKMVDSKLRPNLAVYNRLVDELVKVGKVEEAKSFFDLMVKKLKMDVPSYKFIVKVLSEAGKLDEVLGVIDALLDEQDTSVFGDELREFVEAELRKEGREEDLGKLIDEKERAKAEAKAKEEEAAEATKNRARAAVSSLLPSKLFGPKEPESATTEAEIVTETENKGNGDSGSLSESSSSSSSSSESDMEAVKSESSTGDEASK